MKITSASGIISLLEEDKHELKSFALNKLNHIVDEFWPEISEVIEKIEVLYEDENFKERQLASLVASKVYYHLGSFEDSLSYALGAGNLFDVSCPSQYVTTIIAKCIDHYTKLRIKLFTETDGDKVIIDSRLENIVNRMLDRCFEDAQYKQAIGIALETRRMDILERAVMESDNVTNMLEYSFKITMSLVENRHFRSDILKLLVKMYKNLKTPDYVNMCQCLIFLDDARSVGDVLDKLANGTLDNSLMAYQIAFDLYESATQHFLTRVISAIKSSAPIPSLVGAHTVKTQASAITAADEAVAVMKAVIEAAESKEKTEPENMETDQAADADPSKLASTSTAEPVRKREDLSEEERLIQDRIEKLAIILSGEMTIELELQFLIRNNKTDMLILKQTKETVRNSVCHTATVIANSIMHCGTTSDQFLRDNLDWIGRAVNWAKFTATASLGVIHKGHEKEALHLMQAYLPKDSGPGSGYTEGGGLYALGLIHANHGGAIIDYLIEKLKDAKNQAVRHGGCLGLGLAAMGTNRHDIYEQLKLNLFHDDAVVGEAAGVAMGLVMLGSKAPTAIQDMVAYAQDTQHEKILRGIAIGISLLMFGRLEEADCLIETLCRDKDPLLRRSGMHTIAMAYCGTGNNGAIQKLLHVAVSDVNDDVRRAAVEAIGFILFRNPEQCPSVVSLLTESFNPHVRYGAAMALGICCAGTGNKEAINLLEPIKEDPINYVRQGALIASALILIQQTEANCPKVKDWRQTYAKVIAGKHDDFMAKFGAILAQGIIDCGGRNATINLQSRTGHTNVPAVVGMMVFTGFWYWFPLSHFISLSFSPTCVIGLNADLQMPKLEIKSNAKPSLFAYPEPLQEKKEREREKIVTAVLSTTAKHAKKKEAEKKEKDEKMDVEIIDKDKKEVDESKKDADESKKDDKGESPKDKKEPKAPESNLELLSNPARVLRQQLKVIQMPENSRYEPIKDITIGGIIIMRDTKGEEPQDLVLPVAAGGPKVEDEREAPAPDPFDYVEDLP